MTFSRRQFIGRLGQFVGMLSIPWSAGTSRKRWVTPVQFPAPMIAWDRADATPIDDLRRTIEDMGDGRGDSGERAEREWLDTFFASRHW